MNAITTKEILSQFKEEFLFVKSLIKDVLGFLLGRPLKDPKLVGAMIVFVFLFCLILHSNEIHWVLRGLTLLLAPTGIFIVPGTMLLMVGEPKNEKGRVHLWYRFLMVFGFAAILLRIYIQDQINDVLRIPLFIYELRDCRIH